MKRGEVIRADEEREGEREERRTQTVKMRVKKEMR